MTRNYHSRRFLVKTSVFLVSMLGATALLNYLVNPYDIFPESLLQFDLVKTEISPKLKQQKRVLVYRQKPDCLFIGSSRGQYLDPDYEAMKGFRCLNISGGYISSISRAHEALFYANRISPPSIVILGLDMRMFKAGGFDEAVMYMNRPKVLSMIPQYLFSATTLYDSIVTLLRQLDASLVPMFLSNGQRNSEFEYRKIEKLGGHISSFRATVNSVNTRVLKKVVLDEEVLGHLRSLLQLAYREKIDLRIYFSPSHAWWWNVIAENGYWNLFEEWKRQVVGINKVIALQENKPPFIIHDFTGYYPYTTVVPTKKRMEYHFEASHFTPKLGRKVLDSLMNTDRAEPGFGVSLRPENLDQHLAEIRAQRDNQ